MLKHDTRFMETVAERYHMAWAILCLFQSGIAALVAGMVAPFIHVESLFGFLLAAQYYLQWGLIAFGIAGCLFHVIGARDHAKRRKR